MLVTPADELRFDAHAKAIAQKYYRERREMIADALQELGATGFEFLPTGYWRWPSPDGAPGSILNIVRRLPGILIFAALLALGTPFWLTQIENLPRYLPALGKSISPRKKSRLDEE